MAGAWITISFARLPGESEYQRIRLTRELAGDLRVVAVVQHVPAGSAGVLSVLTTTGPHSVRILVDTVLAFLRRHENRYARLTAGTLEFHLDGATPTGTAALIDILSTAVDSDS